MESQSYKILIAATGSVATLKIPTLIRTLLELQPTVTNYPFQVKLIVTKAAKRFFRSEDLPPDVEMFDDKLAWEMWKQKGDPILHIDLPKEADMLLIAPLDANTMAKISQGVCDNLVTTSARSWCFAKPSLFCPSMTTGMWEHPVTAQHVATLKQWGYIEIPPVSKTLMCGTTGIGAMANVHLIVTGAAKRFFTKEDLPAEVKLYDDALAAKLWQRVGDPILHVELTRLADMLVVAPLNANTMAKIVHGFSDNLVTITIRCWPFEKPLIFCPSMNTQMWGHPVTAQHIATLKKWGYIEIPPVYKKLMCGTVGTGGMAEIETIVQVIFEVVNKGHSENQ